jgi:hypothetical protein
LLNSLGVGANTEMIKAFIISLYLNWFHYDFVILNLKYFLNGLSDVKLLNSFCKVLFILVQNSVIKHVMHEVIDELWRTHDFLGALF